MRSGCRMLHTRYLGLPWPPPPGAYDYALALCRSDLAWEFLRRSPRYQRDYRLNSKGVNRAHRRLGLLPGLTRVRRKTQAAATWGLQSFVDPSLSAPNSPVCWLANPATPLLEALADRAPLGTCPDLPVKRLTSVRHIVLGPGREQYIILRDADAALTLRLHGSRASLAPVNTCILLAGLPDPDSISKALSTLIGLILSPNHDPRPSRDLVFLRDALVALDGRCVGASYREMAAVVYGGRVAQTAWASGSRWMKDRMCRALAKGEQLRDGGYRKLLQ
jgi:hypothetical protein